MLTYHSQPDWQCIEIDAIDSDLCAYLQISTEATFASGVYA